MSLIENAGAGFAELQQRTADFLNVQKLNSSLRTARRDLERLYTVIGETCCRIHEGNGDANVLEPMFEKAAELRAHIAELNRAADKLNRVVRCAKCGTTVSRKLRFCTHCGTQLNTENDEQ